jgi:hypothetical protein
MDRRVILLNTAFYLCVSWLIIFVVLGFCRLKSILSKNYKARYLNETNVYKNVLNPFCLPFPTLEGTFMNYMLYLTAVNVIIGCILFFSYLPHYHHYKSGIRDNAMIKTMKQVIQAWRGLSTISVIVYLIYLYGTKDTKYYDVKEPRKLVYSVRIIEYILFLILGVICGLSYADYSIVPTTTPSVFPMPLPANPLLAPLNTFPMGRTYPTATPTY